MIFEGREKDARRARHFLGGVSCVSFVPLLLLLLLLVRDVQRSTYALGRHGSLYSRIDYSALLIVCYPSG